MSGRAIGTVIVFGLAIGFFFPSAETPSAPSNEVQAAELKSTQPGSSANSGGSSRSSADIVLQRRSNGHFYADVEVDGQTIEFLVDTGASGIALSGDDARKLGLDWNEFDLEPVGRGVSGEVNGKVVKLHHLQLGGKEAWDMDAVIIPNGLDVSLLGQSFLSHIGSVKMSGDEMVLR